jgi:hypothetical protein
LVLKKASRILAFNQDQAPLREKAYPG